jgi:heme-degrading monooxygenase HmoA
MTITRVWRGWTSKSAADDYQRFLLTQLFPSMCSISGFLGADVLRRDDGDATAFVILTCFRSFDDIKAFAGDELDVAVIEPQAAKLLARHDEHATHYETIHFNA